MGGEAQWVEVGDPWRVTGSYHSLRWKSGVLSLFVSCVLNVDFFVAVVAGSK